MGAAARRPFSTNVFERKLISYVVAIVSIPAFVVTLFFLALFSNVIYGYIQSGMADHFMRYFVALAGVLLVSYFFSVLIASYYFVHRLFGSYPRILRELDEIIAGKARHRIRLRTGDYGVELIERINGLIDKLS